MQELSSLLFFNREEIPKNEQLSELLLKVVYPALCYDPEFRDSLA